MEYVDHNIRNFNCEFLNGACDIRLRYRNVSWRDDSDMNDGYELGDNDSVV